MADVALGKRIIALRQRVVANFDEGTWDEVGLLTGHSKLINTYPRLLRSLQWGDGDYSGNVLGVLHSIAEEDIAAFHTIEQFVDEKFPDKSEYISAKPSERRITFAPNAFKVPDLSVETDVVAVMMPFQQEFAPVYKAIRRACADTSLRPMRADDVWEDSTIIQDIFNTIFRAQVVVVDFTGKNANVMYETGIAHTLGKDVVPISQSLADVPFDMQHHRVLKYLPNSEGLKALQEKLAHKLKQAAPQQRVTDDDVPF